LNPTNANSRFAVAAVYQSGQAPRILIRSVLGRSYRLETSTDLSHWSVLRDGLAGTGGDLEFVDYRILSSVASTYYRVAVY